jgi:uncharacterized Zn-binding protein involved in type VI secretion
MGTVIPFRMRRAAAILLLLTCLALVFASCKKTEPEPDWASIIEGTYTGTVTTGSTTVSGTTSLVRYTSTKADMYIAAGSHTLNINGVRITSSGNDIYYLTYSLAGNTLAGNVNGDLLTYTLTSGTLNGTFTGSR